MNCLGCRIVNLLEPHVNIIYEDELVICVLDIAPFNEGHILILPKKHFYDSDEMDRDTLYAIMNASVYISKVLKEVYKPDGITICQNGGMFNDLTHYHMHVIPRFKDDGFTWSDPIIDHKAGTRLLETRNRILQEIERVSQGDSNFR
ncbi:MULTISPECIES: HIT family protein [unclassified Paenibacillus]|uniref:HIT family protein n=1 Tax=unclassified Paenibacillus TaxID=185978 RepID=UPI0031193A6E